MSKNTRSGRSRAGGVGVGAVIVAVLALLFGRGFGLGGGSGTGKEDAKGESSVAAQVQETVQEESESKADAGKEAPSEESKEEIPDEIIVRIEEDKVSINGNEVKDAEELKSYVETYNSDKRTFLLQEKQSILETYRWVTGVFDDLGVYLKTEE